MLVGFHQESIQIYKSWSEQTKKLDADQKAIQWTEFLSHLKEFDNDGNDTNTGDNQNKFGF